MRKFQSNCGENNNIYINWKHLKSISQIKFCRFATTSFNSGELQTGLFKNGLYRKAPLKF